MNNKFVKGAAILTITTFLSKVLGSFFQIPLQNIAGDEVLGIFRLVFPVYMIALTLSVAGVPLAISKLIAELHEKNDENGIAKLFTSASIIGVIFGVLGFSVIMIGSSMFANMLGGQDTRLPLIVTSFALLIAPYMAVYRGYFQGFGDMIPTGVSQVIEQFIRVFFMLAIAFLFVYWNKESDVVTGGAMIGSCLGVITSLIYLRMKYVKSIYRYKSNTYSLQDFKDNAKKILQVSIPIAVGALSMPVLNLVDSVTIPHMLYESTTTIQEQFGIYSRGFAFTQLIVVFASAMVFPLIPLLTAALTKKDRVLAKQTIERTNELAHVLTTPITIWLMSLMVLSIGILQGINRSKQAAWIVVGASFVKVILNIVLVSQFGITGAAYSTLIIYIMICIVNYIYIRKELAYSIHMGRFFAVIGVSSIVGIGLYFTSTFINVVDSRLIAIIYSGVAFCVALFIYGICALKLNWISKKQIPFLRK
ncbi:polysaccharide biosynthesis protein [Bacillus paranthracis]|uniref:putative polysaccharide biosynthesis protein n=1 Tax=Bacillus paranthracis TaxID=2026186 RepID=UPI002E1A6AF5|nr:polysaccharide biosynthesis protein [Bacillus paranthracis]